MNSNPILEYLAKKEAVLMDSHFVFTSGKHGSAYVNMRAVAHDAKWLDSVAMSLAERIGSYRPDIVLGPETLGRTLASITATYMQDSPAAIWCAMPEIDGMKSASFSEKLGFGRLIAGKRIAIVDDLLTTGSSIRLVSELVSSLGGEVIVAAVVVRRSPDVDATVCNVPRLEVLAEVRGFTALTPEECADHGPCSRQVPVVLRPGHGHKWIKSNPDYPSVSLAA